MAAERTASTADAAHGPAPTGTVTFLFSDIEGSTRLVRQLGDEYGALLEQHHGLLRAAFGGHGGHEVDSQGDAFFFAFRRARDAVGAAVAAQRHLLEAEWPQEVDVRVRIGIHTGEPGLVAAGYHGVDVVRAARIAAVAHGGQIVVSTATRDVVGDDALPEVSFLDLGEHLLKDFDRVHRLFQVSAPGLPHEFPALRTERAEAGLDIGGREDDLAAAAGAAVGAGHGTSSGRRRLVAALAVLVLAAAAVLVGLALTREDERAPTIVPNSVVRIEPDTNEIVRVLPVGQNPGAVTTSGADVWVASRSDDTLTHVDSRTDQTRTLGGFPFPTSLDTQGTRIWVGNNTSATLVAIDSETGGEVDRIRFPAAAASYVAHGARSLWVSDEETAVLRVSPSTGDVRRRWSESPHGIAFGHGAAWVANTGPGELLRIDASDGALQRIDGGSLPESVTVGFGAVWVTCSGDDEVRRFNPATGRVERIISVGSQPDDIATGAGAVWVANRNDGTVSRIDPETNRVVATIRIGFSPAGVHVGAGGVWAAVGPASS